MVVPYPSSAPAPAGAMAAIGGAPSLVAPIGAPRADPFPELYVRVMLGVLPILMAAGTHVSSGIARETDYLPEGFSFALTVNGSDLGCAVRKDAQGHWRRIPADDPAARQCTYTIGFRDVDYAFLVFTGAITLKDALAGHYFTTQGPNNTGVALTYMFTIILSTFFFWRSAYREG